MFGKNLSWILRSHNSSWEQKPPHFISWAPSLENTTSLWSGTQQCLVRKRGKDQGSMELQWEKDRQTRSPLLFQCSLEHVISHYLNIPVKHGMECCTASIFMNWSHRLISKYRRHKEKHKFERFPFAASTRALLIFIAKSDV